MINNSDITVATIEETSCNICMHEFFARTQKLSFKGVVLKMKKSIFLWIGNPGDSSSFSNLSYAALNPYQSSPLNTSIISLQNDELSNRLAVRLSKKLDKPVWVSVNLNIDHLSEPELEKLIKNEITINSDKF